MVMESFQFKLWMPLAIAAFLIPARPVAAQWTRVVEVPASDIFSVWANGDTIVAAADTSVSVSTDAGSTWRRSARPAADVTLIRAALVHNGRLYAGTFGQGVFVSNDLGATWIGFSQGLVGGIGNSVLRIVGLVQRGDSLYAATEGAAAWVRNLTSESWTLFGDHTLQDFQASNMDAIAVGGSRLFACGGFNGTVFYRDPGQPDWTVSLLFNDRFAPGLAGLNAIWTGHRWVVGTNIGVFHSATGQEPWTYVDLGVRSVFFVGLATRGTDLFASFGVSSTGSLIALSHDDGVTWQGLDTLAVGVYRLAISGSELYAGRVDGLWRRATPTDVGPLGQQSVELACVGPNPLRDVATLRFALPRAGHLRITVLNVSGRVVATLADREFPAGPQSLALDASRLPSGVYLVRLETPSTDRTLRIVRIR